MAKPKYDGVVECVRYKPNGEIQWVRAYLRRGAIFSDHLLLGRDELIRRLKAGEKFMAGRRQEFMASTFEVFAPIRVIQVDGKDILVTDDLKSDQDRLENVPII